MPIRRALLAGAILTLCATGTAQGATYCVAPKTGCADGDHATIASALAAASATAGTDRVELGAATYTATPVTLSGVDLVGAGIGKTRFDGNGTTSSTHASVIDVSADSSVRDLSVEVPGGYHPSSQPAGLYVSGLVEDVHVTADSLAQAAIGVYVGLNGTARRVRTSIQAVNQHFAGAYGQFGSVIEDSSLRGYYAAVGVNHIRRSVLTGVNGFHGYRTHIENSVIALDSSNAEQEAVHLNGDELSLRNVTVVGDGSGAGIKIVRGIGEKATALVRNTVLHGFNWPFKRTASADGGGAGFDVDYSTFDKFTPVIAEGPGGDTFGTHNLDEVDPRFVSTSITHPFAFRLAHDSPLRNAGDPAVTAGAREGRRDIGAHEFQALAPVATVSVPATAEAGRPLTAVTTASDPDGEALALSIDFGDGSPAGAATEHVYAAAGTYTVTVTATDAEGRTGTGSASITVTAPPATGGGTGGGGGGVETSGGGTQPFPPAVIPPLLDTTPPALTLVSAKVVKRRLRVSLLLGEAAAVKLTVVRSRACRRVEGRRRCTGKKVVATTSQAAAAGPVTIKLAKKLAKGRHVVRVVATDVAGNAGPPVTKKLTVR